MCQRSKMTGETHHLYIIYITRARIISTQENGQAQPAEARRAANCPSVPTPPFIYAHYTTRIYGMQVRISTK